METLITTFLSTALQTALQEGLNYMVNNPQALEEFCKSFFAAGCHNAVDVAQDALDAYDHGHLTREQALEIVTICLKKQNPTVDVKAKRIELEKLFN